ncbi:MFS transporter [Amycolatopsis benzoatilytica]|uniref:MFS transporter n=1 Tax=Amycolatopsis benzoatilytica TaxID=346045 RepID=UPI00035E238F|nr:MFS transporter [Amycolatopsis benzoatilytica]
MAATASAAQVGPLLPAPVAKAPPRVVATMALAQLGLFFALLTPVMASLAIKVQTLTGPDGAVAALGTVSSAGAVAAFLANPVFGRISDRTTGRFGRRRPWLVLGATGLTVCLVVIAVAHSLLLIAIAWFVGQAFANAALAALMATVADQIPMRQRGKVSGLLGVMQQVGILGSAYAAQFLGADLLLLFLIPGLVGLALTVLFALVLPDRQLPHRPPADGFATVLKTFWVSPRKHPDFAWAWVSRFMVILASFLFTTYRLLYMQHELSLTLAKATAVMATGVLLYTIMVAITGQAAGWLSDRLRRRKPFVAAATVLFGLGMVLLVHADTIGGFYVAEIVLGAGYGVYMGVDLALVVDVLPNPDDSAKDLGVLNIANAAPQALAPALGALLIGVGGGQNYSLLLWVAAAVCVVGAAAILPIKTVR